MFVLCVQVKHAAALHQLPLPRLQLLGSGMLTG